MDHGGGGGRHDPDIMGRRCEASAQSAGSPAAKPAAVCPGRHRHRGHVAVAILPLPVRGRALPRLRVGGEGQKACARHQQVGLAHAAPRAK